MWRITRLGLAARRRRLLRLVVAVGLGVAFLTGTLVLGDTLRQAYHSGYVKARAGVGTVVKSKQSFAGAYGLPARTMLLDGALADRIGTVDGVASVAPVLQGYAALQGTDGKVLGARGTAPVGGAWIADSALNPYRLTAGRAPAGADEVVINSRAAADGHLAVGDKVTADVPQPVQATVVGIAQFASGVDLGDATYVAFDPDAARQYFAGGRDLASSFLVRATAGTSDAALAARVSAALPADADAEAVTGAADGADAADQADSSLVNSLQGFLFLFAAVALVVAVSSVASTFSIVFAQRTRELGLLRAVGATRRQVLAAAVGEALAAGLVAAAVGTAAGVGLGGGLKAMLSGFGFSLPAGSPAVTPTAIATGLVVGVLLTVLAVIGPALRASRIPAVAALADGTSRRAGAGARSVRTIAGLVLLAAGVALGAAGAAGHAPRR